MSSATPDAVDALEYDARTGKRAVYEELELEPRGDGTVEVRNASHDDPEAHSYTVEIVSGLPARCSCPAWEYHDGACKHMVRVGMAESVIDAAGDSFGEA